MWHIRTMEIHLTVKKKNQVKKNSGKWMDIERMALNELTQTQKVVFISRL